MRPADVRQQHITKPLTPVVSLWVQEDHPFAVTASREAQFHLRSLDAMRRAPDQEIGRGRRHLL